MLSNKTNHGIHKCSNGDMSGEHVDHGNMLTLLAPKYYLTAS